MSPTIDRPRYLLAYIAGAGHCGSTLLNLLLNAHSEVLGLSELSSIGEHVSGKAESTILGDPFWVAVKRRYRDSTGSAFSDLDLSPLPAARIFSSTSADIEKWTQPNRDLLDCLFRESEARVLVDASKSWQRLALLLKSGSFDLRVIHLMRDGRAVYNSYRSKYQRPVFALTKWPKFTIAALLLRRRFGKSEWLDLRYEDLARDPATALASVCSLLDLDFEPAMLRYREHPNLGLGGNRMATGSDQGIQLDERWRTELTLPRRLAFGLLFGWLNRLLGYK
ncbi:MAG: sulfotransferase [bacterium]|nr:sulfotransferase [bacterium]